MKSNTAITFMLTGMLCAGQLMAQNAMINSGFENGLSGWGQVNEGTTSATMEVDNTIFFSGSSCGKVTLNEGGALGGFAQNIALVAGESYEVRCRCKTDALDGLALPYLNLNDNNLLLEFGILPISGTTDWYEATSRFICPDDVTNATFFLFVQGNIGIAYFDDVTFTRILDIGGANFSVDPLNEIGLIRPLMHVNAGPLQPGFSSDISSQFQSLGIQSVRTHDFYGPCDIHTIFPDFNADASDPANYNFESTDEVIESIIATGAEVFFRLGESFNSQSLYNAPPSDNQKMAEISKNIVRHYNDGWNNGFNYGIEYWEIWNEPDLYHFWSGTALEFTTMYGVIASELKAYNPQLKIIGPAVSSMISEWFVDEFLAGVSQFNYPLDGFSYHIYYMANPFGFALMDQRTEAKLAQYGLEDIPHYVTEWNNYAYSSNGTTEIWRNDPYSGASTAAALIYYQDTEVERAHRYRANEFLFGMFDDNSNITYSGLAYEQFSKFIQHPTRLHTTGGDSLGFTILAGKNQLEGDLQFLVANNGSAHSSYSVDVENIASNEIYEYTVFRADSTHLNEVLTTGVLDTENHILNVPCAAPFSDKIELEHVIIEGVSDMRNEVDFSISPNPASSVMNISFHQENISSGKIMMIDMQGKVVLQTNIAPNEKRKAIDISNLTNGQYQVLITQESKHELHSIQVLR